MKVSRRHLFGLLAAAPFAPKVAAALPAAPAVASPEPVSALSMTMAEYSEHIIRPAMARLAAEIEADTMAAWTNSGSVRFRLGKPQIIGGWETA